jgi:hypothetical protein
MPPASSRVRVREVVLPQQILPIIIPVGGSHHTVDMLLRLHLRIDRKLRQIRRPLVVEFKEIRCHFRDNCPAVARIPTGRVIDLLRNYPVVPEVRSMEFHRIEPDRPMTPWLRPSSVPPAINDKIDP